MQKTPLLVFFALGLLPIALQAATLGLPPTAPYSTGSVELYWERYRTDIEQEFRLSGGQTFIGEQRENRWVGRSTFRAGDNWLVHALSGGTDSEASTGSVPLIGLGTEWTAWEKNKSGISWVASIEYAHGIT